MLIPEIFGGLMLVIGVVAFKRKTSLYWVAGVLAGYVLVKYLTRFEHLSNEDKTKRLAQINKDIEYLKSVGMTESSENDTMRKLVAERKQLTSTGSSSAGDDKTKRLAQIAKDIEYLKSVGLTESSDNETMKKLVAERKSLTDPPVPKTVTMAAPEPTKVPEKKEPWSLCSIQS